MSGLSTKPVMQQKEQNMQRGTFVKRVAGFTMAATAVALIAAPVAEAFYAQDKYTLTSPSGIPFSDFRGYEDWSVASIAKTDVCSRQSLLIRR
jgi:hypothetical protein